MRAHFLHNFIRAKLALINFYIKERYSELKALNVSVYKII